MKYTPLESDIPGSLGVTPPSFDGSSVSFLTTTSFVYTLFFSAIILAAFYRYSVAGASRMQASEEGIRRSNDIIKKTTLGLLGVFSLFLILSTVNKDLLLGDVGLGALNAGKSSVVATNPSIGSGGGSNNCTPPQDTINAINSGNVCGNAICKVLTGCNYQQYLPFLKAASGGDSTRLKMLIVILCKESTANPKASHLNPDSGTYDCGLMQVNMPKGKTCTDDPTIFDPQTNINKGAAILFSKMGAQTYGGVPAAASVFASYNCCSSGNPNDQSVSCNSGTGFNSPIPKWACPIDPGQTATNMCFVKNYACELNACLNDASLNSL